MAPSAAPMSVRRSREASRGGLRRPASRGETSGCSSVARRATSGGSGSVGSRDRSLRTQPVGTYGNVRRLRRQGNGTFAGDADRQRQGSFADTDRDVMITYDHETAHARVVGARGLRRLLRDAALDDDAIDRVVDDLHTGQAVVLAEIAEITRSDAQERLEHVATAA